MGYLGRINQARKYELRKTRMSKLSREIQAFYAEHLVAPWQQDRVKEIRALCEYKYKALDKKYLELKQELTEEFMQHEVDFLHASHKFREENPGKEWRAQRSAFDQVASSVKSMFSFLSGSKVAELQHGEKTSEKE